MSSFCGADCTNCGFFKKNSCKGCIDSNGCPYGSPCFIAKYIRIGGQEEFERLKIALIDEFNVLHIPGLPKITDLVPLNGFYVNLEYSLPGGTKTKFLKDNEIYLGTQKECEFNDGEINRCFGLVANTDFLLISEYGPNGSDPEIVFYKKR